MIALYALCFLAFCAIFICYIFWCLYEQKPPELSREQFEAWYISKFLNVMGDAKESIISLRNDYGGYDDPHMDGAWEAWNAKQ